MDSDIIGFAAWYYRTGRPHKPPRDMTIFRTDNASSVCVYRDGRYQVELYLIDVDAPIPRHQHPGVNAIEVDQHRFLGMDITESDFFLTQLEQFALYDGQWHGNGIEEKCKHSGYYLVSCQYWLEDRPMKTISTRWVGKTVGPVHDALIKAHNPDAYVIPGYADVTRSKFDSDVL